MKIEFDLTKEMCNTQYGPLAVLIVAYQQRAMLKPLEGVELAIKQYKYSPANKLEQVLLSVLAGCET